MQITRAGEYAVQGLMHLARRPAGQVAMIDEVSRGEQIPRSFLAKIFQSLARSGLVRSTRGTGGGFVLARDPSEITVLEIVQSVEGRKTSQNCKLAKPDCKHAGGCALCGLFEQAQDGLRDVLLRTKLSDLVREQDHLELVRARARDASPRRPGPAKESEAGVFPFPRTPRRGVPTSRVAPGVFNRAAGKSARRPI